MRVVISEDCGAYEGLLAGKEGIVSDEDWVSIWPKVRVDVENIDYYIERKYIKSYVENAFENMARVHINGVDRTNMFKEFKMNKENTKMAQVSEKIKTIIKVKFTKERNDLDKKYGQEVYDYKLNSKAGKEFIKFKKLIGKFDNENPLYDFSEDWLSDDDKKCMSDICEKHRDQMYDINKRETELVALLEVTDTFDQKLQLLNAYGVTDLNFLKF